MLFKRIAGHNDICKQITKAVRENRISHAQMFLGPEGCGNLALALAYAQYVNCTDKQADDSCGVCDSCIKTEKLIHPDLHFVYPVANTKNVKNAVSDEFINDWRNIITDNPFINLNTWYDAIGMENKQGIIGKEESQQIIKKLNLKTFEGEYKIMVIWMAEKMNESCANKILKILEEPPEKTLFLLVCESTELILPTILSRSQILKVPKLKKENIVTLLTARYGNSEIDIEKTAHLANGNFFKALKLVETDHRDTENHKFFTELMRISYKKDVLTIMNWVDHISSLGREGLKSFFQYSLRMVRENYLLNMQLKEISYLDEKEADFSSKFHAFITSDNVDQITEELSKAHSHIEYNAYSKIVLLDMSIKLFSLINPRKNA